VIHQLTGGAYKKVRMAEDPELSSRATAAASSPLRLRPSMTPLGPRGRTRSSAALELSSPVLSRTTTPDITPASPKLESQSPHALVETPPVSKPPSTPPAIKPINKPPPLTIPSSISFESTPVQWKGLPLEAALCTYSSCHVPVKL